MDCLASHQMLGNWEFVRKFLAETPPEQVRPTRLLTGDDLMALGFQAGPVFKSILQSVEDAQLDGRLRTKDEAVQFVKAGFWENSPS
jgi:poly(A) polymerase